VSLSWFETYDEVFEVVDLLNKTYPELKLDPENGESGMRVRVSMGKYVVTYLRSYFAMSSFTSGIMFGKRIAEDEVN